ncbi:hypothetical protein D8674_042307 [Pyrus ussuriensis x Pyrus communis]|uniref:Uncharacterized protein n=1 Tax=Pyrus ussuriensis x Pyrus communis TaxID=2448454 RepID=A0A5N5H5X4_9ROSA|nr:hypothetical protein D8674_042307 [Pyrus ussuriensis x Pyrus communis]
MSLSRDVRELKEATGKEVTFYVETKDKKLFCVTGQYRVEDMLAQHAAKVEVSDDQESSESKTLGQVVDHDKCGPQWIKPIKTMGEEELKLHKISLLEVKKGMEKATEQKSTATGGSSGLTSVRDGSATATNSPSQTQLTNPNVTNQRFRRKLISLSRDVRESKETTRGVATVFVATEDKKLYCVTGQDRVRSVPRVDNMGSLVITGSISNVVRLLIYYEGVSRET